MVRSWSIVLGIGLAILWVAGMNDPYAPGWLVWLDGVAALISFLVAGMASDGLVERRDAAGPFALALGLGLIWAIGLAERVVPWVAWWTFAFACAFAAVGVMARRGPVVRRDEDVIETLDRIGTMDRARDRFRRGA